VRSLGIPALQGGEVQKPVLIVDVIKAITLKTPVAGSMHYETDMTPAANGCPYGDQQIPVATRNGGSSAGHLSKFHVTSGNEYSLESLLVF
jgi:hypothetical protein